MISSSAGAGFGGVRDAGDPPRLGCRRPRPFAENGGDQVAQARVEGGLEGGFAGVLACCLANELDELWPGRSQYGLDLQPEQLGERVAQFVAFPGDLPGRTGPELLDGLLIPVVSFQIAGQSG